MSKNLFDIESQQRFFKKLCSKDNLLDNRAGGDCFFYSIINNIENTELNTLSVDCLRLMVAMELRNLENNHEHELYYYIEQNRNFTEYCKLVSMPGKWIDINDFEIIASLIAEKFNINIIILSKFKRDGKIISNLYKSKNKSTTNRIILYYESYNNHYQTIIKKGISKVIDIDNFIQIES